MKIYHPDNFDVTTKYPAMVFYFGGDGTMVLFNNLNLMLIIFQKED